MKQQFEQLLKQFPKQVQSISGTPKLFGSGVALGIEWEDNPNFTCVVFPSRFPGIFYLVIEEIEAESKKLNWWMIAGFLDDINEAYKLGITFDMFSYTTKEGTVN